MDRTKPPTVVQRRTTVGERAGLRRPRRTHAVLSKGDMVLTGYEYDVRSVSVDDSPADQPWRPVRPTFSGSKP